MRDTAKKTEPEAVHLRHEQSVIGGTMVWSEDGHGPLPREVLALEPEHFTDRRHAWIWVAVAELVGGGHGCDLSAVCAKVQEHRHKGLLAYLMELNHDGLTSNLDHHACQVWESGQQRLLKGRIDEIVNRAEGDSYDDVRADVLDAIKGAERISDGKGFVHIRDVIPELMSDLCRAVEDPEAAVIAKTGLKDLDRTLLLEPGAMTIIAGRPGVGKTALAGMIARHCARDLTRGATCFVSLEMAAKAVVKRLFMAEAKATSEQLPQLAESGDLTRDVDSLWRCDLYFDDRTNLTTDDIRQALKVMPHVRLVVVDYIQLAGLDRKLDRHDLRIGAVAKGLKAISKDFRCHVIGLSQLSRKTESHKDAKPQLSDLRDSGNLEEDADNVLLLWRPDYHDSRAEGRGTIEINIAKQRNGEQGVVPVAWMPKTQTFADLTKKPEPGWDG